MPSTVLEPSLKTLSSGISANVDKISQILESKSLPQTSFKPDSPKGLPLDEEVQVARQALIDQASKLLHLAMGPEDFIRWSAFGLKHDNAVLSALNHFNFWDTVPLNGTTPYAALAKKVGLNESRVRRLLRHAYTMSIFYESENGQVAHTATSALLVQDVEMRAWIAHNCEELLPASAHLNEALEKYGDSSDPKETGFHDAYGKTVFQLFDEDVGPKKGQEKGWRAKRFGTVMKVMNTSGAHSQHFIHEAFDWDALGEATMVDVGGSTGHISAELAHHHPKMKFIVQDLPSVESEFERHLEPSLAPRMSFQAHDFFTPEPVKGADVYFLKHILHDWADPISIKILQQLLPAMIPGKSRIIIMDGVVPEYGEVPTAIMRLHTCMDLQMMMSLNAKERTEKDWKELVQSADQRLRVVACVVPFGSAHGVIEVVLDEEK